NGFSGSLSNKPRRKRHTGFALMENEHGPCVLADDEVALPMAGFGSGVDRLATHRPQTAFVSRFQPTRDLLGRPSFRKTIADESPQFLIFFEDGFTPPAQLIGSGGVKRRITPAREAVAPQFPRHGGFRSL